MEIHEIILQLGVHRIFDRSYSELITSDPDLIASFTSALNDFVGDIVPDNIIEFVLFKKSRIIMGVKIDNGLTIIIIASARLFSIWRIRRLLSQIARRFKAYCRSKGIDLNDWGNELLQFEDFDPLH